MKYILFFIQIVLFSSCGSFGEGLLAGLGGYGYGGYAPAAYDSGNMNYLLDPNYAVAQTMAQQNQYNQVFNSFAQQTVNQVTTQEEQEYQEFCKYNKKSDGTNYTKSEWRALKGQAIQNTKSSGSFSNSSSSSSNVSSSSGKRCKKLSSSDMAHCEGTGVCQRCNGNKRYYTTSFGNGRWVDPCTICGGSGKCPSCNGKGFK